MNKPSTLVIGIGNEYRGDDSVGLLVCRELSRLRPSGCEIVESHGEGTSLMQLWQGYSRVIIVDAINSGDRPGRIHRFDLDEREFSSEEFRCSSHVFALADAVRLARTLDTLPRRVLILGVEAVNFGFGAKVDTRVEIAVEQIVDLVLEELAHSYPGSIVREAVQLRDMTPDSRL